MSAKGKAPLPSIDAPLPDLNNNSNDDDDRSLFSSFKLWVKGLLKKDSPTFTPESDADVHKPFTLRQCCNWGNIRTRLLLMTILDLLSSMYGLASANRVRLISPLLNITGLMFMWILVIGMCITGVGIIGILTQRSAFIQVFFYWSMCAMILNFVLSLIDLNTISDQCDFIWNNFDHSAYKDSDRQLFARQCESYAFVFFAVVAVGIFFARLYYVWSIRSYYISITPDHEQYSATRGAYQPVHSGGGTAYRSGGYAVNHASEEEEDDV